MLAVEQGDIGVAGLAASGILVAVAVAISLWRQLGLERSLLWASLRALVQLLAVGWVLQFVVDPDDPLIFSVLWIVAMVSFAGVHHLASGSRRAQGAAAVAARLHGVGDRGARGAVRLRDLRLRGSHARAARRHGDRQLARRHGAGVTPAVDRGDRTARRDRRAPCARAVGHRGVPAAPASGVAHRARAADRVDQGGRDRVPARRDGRPDPRRRRSGRCGQGAGVGDVPRARQRRDHHGGDEPRDLAASSSPRRSSCAGPLSEPTTDAATRTDRAVTR